MILVGGVVKGVGGGGGGDRRGWAIWGGRSMGGGEPRLCRNSVRLHLCHLRSNCRLFMLLKELILSEEVESAIFVGQMFFFTPKRGGEGRGELFFEEWSELYFLEYF